MVKQEMFPTGFPPDSFYKTKKKVKKYKKVTGKPAETFSAEIEKKKPVGQTDMLRTIKVSEQNIGHRKELREWISQNVILERFKPSDCVILSRKGTDSNPSLVGMKGTVAEVDGVNKFATVKWENGEMSTLPYGDLEFPISTIREQ